MTRGKKTCKILKEIRQEIADKNEIEYTTSECHFEGECLGTCPKCEAELKYIENELNRRKQLGKAATIAGISLGIAGTFSACNAPKQPDALNLEQKITDTVAVRDTISTIPPPPIIDILGDIPISGDIITIPIVDTVKKVDDGIYPGGIGGEETPVFPGGEQARMKFLQENVIYPQEAKEKGIEGRVIVGFVVEVDGSLTHFEILRSAHPLLNEEALRVAKLMPKWTHGKQENKPIRMRYQMPITFSSDEEK